MSRRPARFTLKDVARATKGALEGGITVTRVKISPDGSIVLYSDPVEEDMDSDLDEELSKHRSARGYG